MKKRKDGSYVETFNGNLGQNGWHVANHAIEGDWMQTGWSPGHVSQKSGAVSLRLTADDIHGKSNSGAEISTTDTFSYGRYEVTMRASGEEGVNSNFFIYTGPYYGSDWNEIDFEFLGKDPTKVWVAYHKTEEDGSPKGNGKWVDLGFDASESMRTYAFEWEPNAIRWYAEDNLLREVDDPDLELPDEPGRIFMNIWTGMPEWLGDPNFGSEAQAHYKEVRFIPHGEYESKSGKSENKGAGQAPSAEGETAASPFIAWLVDAEQEERLVRLEDGAQMDMDLVADRNLTVLVELEAAWSKSSDVESIHLDFNSGRAEIVENIAPYALFGDQKNGDLNSGDLYLDEGEYRLDLAFYERDFAQGALIRKDSLTFEFV